MIPRVIGHPPATLNHCNEELRRIGDERPELVCEVQSKQMEEEDDEKIEEGLSRLHLPSPETTLDSEEDDAPEEEEEEEESVMLGFVQQPENSDILARHFFPSKAGGTPAWLDPVNIPGGNDPCCGICGNPLQFLIQVYAPIEGNDQAFHRTLFVFACPSMACLNQDQIEQRKSLAERTCRSVKVFRCQLPRRNDFYSLDPPKHDGHDAPSSSGVALCSWCGTWKGGKICSGCKFARYCSRKHQIDHWRTGHAAACHQIHAMSELGCQGNCLARPASTCLWPEFEMTDDEEGNFDFEELDEEVSQNALVANQKTDKEFLRQFKDMEASRDQKHWASFQARLSRAPDQVLRYCRSRNAKPLWPRLEGQPQNTDIPDCIECQGPRCFEFQILPQLLYFFRVQNDVDSFDWGTIAIYSCAASCGTNAFGYVEEFAWVQLSS